jgi:transposase-like protein
MSVTEVALRNGVTRQTLHAWLRRYANGGLAALADKSSNPESCSHQMSLPLLDLSHLGASPA